MHCPNCSHDHQAVFVKPERFPTHDLRTAQCSQCGTQMELMTTIKTVYVFNPITEEREAISLERFTADDFPAVLRGDKAHPAKAEFQKEHGDA